MSSLLGPHEELHVRRCALYKFGVRRGGATKDTAVPPGV